MNDNLILIYIELTDGKDVAPGSLECITAGKKVIGGSDGKLAGLLMGAGMQEAIQKIANRGLDILYSIEDERFQQSAGDLVSDAIVQACMELKPSVLIMANTANAEDLAPRIACALDTGVVTDCIAIKCDQGDLLFVKPVYSSNVIAEFSIMTEPRIATMRSRAYDAPEPSGQMCDVVSLAADFSRCESRIELVGRTVGRG